MLALKTKQCKIRENLNTITDATERGTKHKLLLGRKAEILKKFRSEILKGYASIHDEIESYRTITQKHLQTLAGWHRKPKLKFSNTIYGW